MAQANSHNAPAINGTKQPLTTGLLIPAEINLLISAQIYLQAAIADLENSKLATVISLNIDLLSILSNPFDEIFSDIVL